MKIEMNVYVLFMLEKYLLYPLRGSLITSYKFLNIKKASLFPLKILLLVIMFGQEMNLMSREV